MIVKLSVGSALTDSFIHFLIFAIRNGYMNCPVRIRSIFFDEISFVFTHLWDDWTLTMRVRIRPLGNPA